jgi:Domain of unknown function (DUF4380)
MFIDLVMVKIIKNSNNHLGINNQSVFKPFIDKDLPGVKKLKITTVFVFVSLIISQLSQAQMQEYSLKTPKFEVVITPDAGGRVLSLAGTGQNNFLKIGDIAQEKLLANIDANAGFVPYFGHEVWFGPQSEWWTHQSVNPQRREMKAMWPPDPFSVLTKNHIITQSADKIVLSSQTSPVTGLAVEKTFALVADDPRQLDLIVKAKNGRNTEVAWDIWFNTRSFPQTRIYAPVDATTEVRTMAWPSAESVPVNYDIDDNLLSLRLENPPEGKSKLMGKILFQPTDGWFAAFNKKQLLIVQFPYLPIEKIHPEQGQLEFYMEYSPNDDKLGVLEMEVHSAYKKLKPGEAMQARERWTLIQYSGDESIDAQREFLKEQLKGLKAF